MKPGDLVRFKKFFPPRVDYYIGLLVSYSKWEKVATVLYQGEVLRLRAENVTKAGKRDFLDPNFE